MNLDLDVLQLRARLDQGLVAMDPKIGKTLDDPAREQLLDYLVLLHRWNGAYNLTAVRDPALMVPRHLLDSLVVLPWLKDHPRTEPLLDAGTGAGLPGLVLAIARPDLRFSLLDSNGKKIRFVRQAIAELGLTNAYPVQARLEAYRPETKFATIVVRALAGLPQLYADCRHLAASHARLIALKGRIPESELTALRSLKQPPKDIKCDRLQVPMTEGERSLIIVSFAA